ncbi:MAG: hypothetical protein JWM19_2314 [Actinomycetia bacterium]|nr:hypothetical protein [Actinomycetes bacterium]
MLLEPTHDERRDVLFAGLAEHLAMPAGQLATLMRCSRRTEMIASDVLESHFADADAYATWSVLTGKCP